MTRLNFLKANSILLYFLQKLEKLLPSRPKLTIPEGEHVEEVNLVDFDETRGSGGAGRSEAYHSDDDDDGMPGMGGQRVQCAHQ